MNPLKPVDVRPLFAPLHDELTTLLRGLDAADWQRPTVAGSWRVADVAAHLLDVQVRAVSALRDGHGVAPDGPIDGYDDLVGFLDRLNDEWIRAARRISPALLVEMLEIVGARAAEIWAAQSLDEAAPYAVDWAGVDESRQWMHVGREYTEVWHHQMQIRDAVDAPRLLAERWLRPLLDLSVRALPRTYRDVEADEGSTLVFEVTAIEEETRYAWTLQRDAEHWRLFEGAPEAPPGARVRLEADESWRLLYNARAPDAARRRAEVEGDESLVEPFLRARSVMVRAPRPAQRPASGS